MDSDRPAHRPAARRPRAAHAHSRGGSRGARPLTPGVPPELAADSDRLAELAAEHGLPVEELLREVADLRLALATDLTIAAAAVEAGAGDIAAAVVDGDRAAVADFQVRLADLFAGNPALPPGEAPAEATRPLAAHRRSPLRPTPLIAAAASLVFLLGGILAGPRFSEPAHAPNQLTLDAQARYRDFSNLVSSDASAAQVIAASTKLHDSLTSLLATDPTTVVNLLNSEQLLLLSSDPAGTSIVLADVQELVRLLRATAPAGAKAALDAVVLAPTPRPRPANSPAPAASPSPAGHPSASPSARPSPHPSSSPHPSTGPSPSPTPLIVAPHAP